MPQLHDSTSRSNTDAQLSAHEYSFDRIFGLETEYGLSVTGTDHAIEAGAVAVTMFRPVVEHARSTNTYEPNGARLYLDVGSHPEYATAEARSPFDALVNDAAGEQIMRSMALTAQQQLRKQEQRHQASTAQTNSSQALIHLFKNNADSAGHSFGCHENYLIRRFVHLQDITNQLLPFLITRQIMTGAGRFADGHFRITQRATFVDETVSSATTRSRPMVNTRDEPHANPEQFRRLHVIIGDSNRSQWATRMKLAMTHLVLCVIEHYARLEQQPASPTFIESQPSSTSPFASFALADPVAANHAIDEFGAHAVITLATGEQLTALELQQRYLAGCQQFLTEFSTHVDRSLGEAGAAQHIADEWQSSLELLSRDDFESLAHTMDWAAKLQLYSRLVSRMLQINLEQAQQMLLGRENAQQLPNAVSARLAQLDLDYHDIANGQVFESLVRHGYVRQEVTQQQAEQAVSTPPSHTRAVLRGQFIQAAEQAGVRFTCDWTSLEVLEPHKVSIQLLDPFVSSAAEVPQLTQVLDDLVQRATQFRASH
ncbi:proteasome accessory factor PafA [Bifidobacterium dolichotidis]|uniref:Proteasome accessory factor PafA n=1 Tax=Bifidobacterium dolichotidis TaxID=2306976 RepID=A0A430FPK2_9BIFI|nr:proteasome accessory factor PafA2 family protein [Bifidobacterium dolichotidis]RSX54745.1 proteasome accessory factor PafA [Bifidobacterium dolichotidis]